MAWLTNKKTGARFNTDWIDKEKQIEWNKEQANIRNAPVDLRDKNIGSMPAKGYKKTAQDYYDKVAEHINSNNSVKDLDLNDVKAVVNKAKELLRASNAKGLDSCFRTAAGVAAILDKRGVKYKCLCGAAISNPDKRTLENKNSIKANHVWVKTNTHIYEYFVGQESNIVHLNITDEIIFNKKK